MQQTSAGVRALMQRRQKPTACWGRRSRRWSKNIFPASLTSPCVAMGLASRAGCGCPSDLGKVTAAWIGEAAACVRAVPPNSPPRLAALRGRPRVPAAKAGPRLCCGIWRRRRRRNQSPWRAAPERVVVLWPTAAGRACGRKWKEGRRCRPPPLPSIVTSADAEATAPDQPTKRRTDTRSARPLPAVTSVARPCTQPHHLYRLSGSGRLSGRVCHGCREGTPVQEADAPMEGSSAWEVSSANERHRQERCNDVVFMWHSWQIILPTFFSCRASRSVRQIGQWHDRKC